MKTIPATRVFALTMLVLATIGLAFSALIMHDKVQLLLDSSFTPACTLNEVISCTDVMQSDQASTFGFANPFLGIIGFPVVMTLAVVLACGIRLPRWIWIATAVGLGLGVVFVHYLAYAAVYEIVALCPYCMVVWVVMLALFVMVVAHLSREKRRAAGEDVAHSIFSPALLILVAWYMGFLAVILEQFVF
jgi:uncharacterized membrane protein